MEGNHNDSPDDSGPRSPTSPDPVPNESWVLNGINRLDDKFDRLERKIDEKLDNKFKSLDDRLRQVERKIYAFIGGGLVLVLYLGFFSGEQQILISQSPRKIQ